MNRKEIVNFFEENNNINLSYSFEIKRDKKGPTFVVFASVHGNEPVGGYLAVEFLQKIKKNPNFIKKGKIIFVLVNYKAFLEDKRYIDIDLNRNVLSEGKDSFEKLRAKEICDYFKNRKIDYFLDLHSVSIGNVNMIAIKDDNIKTQNYVLKNLLFSKTIFLFNEKSVPNTTLKCFNKDNTDLSLTVECGNHNDFKAINIARKFFYSILKDKDFACQCSDFNENQFDLSEVEIYKTEDIIYAGSNFKYLINNPQTGTFVKKGTPISKTDEYGIQKSKGDYYIFMPAKEKKVSKKDYEAGFLCSKIKKH